MTIQRIDCDTVREHIARTILEALPDWFGIPEATEEYIADSKGRPFLCAYDGGIPIGFLYLKETGRHTVELAVMGDRRLSGVAILSSRSRLSRWADTQFTTPQTISTSLWVLRNWRYSPRCGMNAIHVRFISWRYESIIAKPAYN